MDSFQRDLQTRFKMIEASSICNAHMKINLLIFCIFSLVKNKKASGLKCLYLKSSSLCKPLRSKFSSKAHFNFMHLAFVNGSNKRDFYVMRKEAKKRVLSYWNHFL